MQYIKYISQFSLGVAEVVSAMDITKLGGDLATSLTGTADTKAMLGAISAGLTGSRLSIEKNFFDQKTAQALVSQMNAQRKAALVPIVQNMQQGVDKYPLATAVVDLQNYYAAGTLEGAVQGIQEEAAAKEQAADNSITAAEFGTDDSTYILLDWIYPGYKSTNAKNQRLDKDGKVIDAIDGNLKALRAWMDADPELKNNTTIAELLDEAKYAAARARALIALKIKK